MLSKIAKFRKSHEKDIILMTMIILVAFISFGLGRLSKIRENKTPITIEFPAKAGLSREEGSGKPKESTEIEIGDKKIVASKNGSKYHFPWCSGAQRIKDSNKIWFSSTASAKSAGYTPAKNCKGLE